MPPTGMGSLFADVHSVHNERLTCCSPSSVFQKVPMHSGNRETNSLFVGVSRGVSWVGVYHSSFKPNSFKLCVP